MLNNTPTKLFSLVKFERKNTFRAWVLKYRLINIDLSSIFCYNGGRYVLIAGTVNFHNDPDLLIEVIDINVSSPELKLLYEWAYSELNSDKIRFVQLESMSYLLANGRGISLANGSIVIRTFEYLTEVLAIINYTRDSFSDGGKYNKIDRLLEQVIRQVQHGAEIIDLGVESTNPSSVPVEAKLECEQLNLILPEILKLRQEYKFKLSIDTYHKETIQWLDAFAIDMINDVSGNIPLALVQQITQAGKQYIAMHSLTIPARTDTILGLNLDPVQVIADWMRRKMNVYADNNIDLRRVIFDPGIGFGNNPAQAWELIANLSSLRFSPCELLLGHSRKSFFAHVSKKKVPAARDIDTTIVSAKVINQVDYLRLHDITTLNELYPVFHQLRFV